MQAENVTVALWNDRRTIGGGDDTAHLARTGALARILKGEEEL